MTFRNKLVSGVALGLIFLFVIEAISYASFARSKADVEWVTHTHVVLEKLADLRAAVLAAETNQRGVILTDDESYLTSYTDALALSRRDLSEIRALTSDNPAQQANLDRLTLLVDAKFAQLQSRIDILHRSGLAASIANIEQAPGRGPLDRVLAVLSDMEAVEHGLLTQRQATAEAATARTRVALLIGNACALFFLALAGVAIQQEMAHRRRAENVVRELNVGLEQRVAERTAELAQSAAQLAERNKDLARSNTELQQFAYVASHDLQEPLRMVASFTQLLAKRYSDKLDQDARDYIQFAVDGATRLQTLITDLLAFSRVGTHAKPLQHVTCDSVLDRTINNLKLAIADSAAQITRDPLPLVNADPIQLSQLFQNLLTNAMKFRGSESPRIHISAARSGDRWKITVRDNGIGIASEHAERIFIIFQRLHTRTEYPGTGIGLAICKKIVERHGGTIWIEPSPGGGSTFCFTIPVVADPAPQEDPRHGIRAAVAAH